MGDMTVKEWFRMKKVNLIFDMLIFVVVVVGLFWVFDIASFRSGVVKSTEIIDGSVSDDGWEDRGYEGKIENEKLIGDCSVVREEWSDTVYNVFVIRLTENFPYDVGSVHTIDIFEGMFEALNNEGYDVLRLDKGGDKLLIMLDTYLEVKKNE